MSRLGTLLNGRGSHKLLVPFFTVGYPNLKQSIKLVSAAIDSGADMIELGMPFSDPMADGPDIQMSSQVALENGVGQREILGIIEAIRARTDLPLILMGYYNPVLATGNERFCARVRAAGADGLIIPDLPVEEAGQLAQPAGRNGLSMIYLVSPTSSDRRVVTVDRASTDLVYAVTVTGVTGGRTGFTSKTTAYLKRLRRQLTKPFVAGFGVSSPTSALQLARLADGVVIGSALIKTFRAAKNQTSGTRAVARLLSSIRKALK